jgi:hypothetical protein
MPVKHGEWLPWLKANCAVPGGAASSAVLLPSSRRGAGGRTPGRKYSLDILRGLASPPGQDRDA